MPTGVREGPGLLGNCDDMMIALEPLNFDSFVSMHLWNKAGVEDFGHFLADLPARSRPFHSGSAAGPRLGAVVRLLP